MNMPGFSAETSLYRTRTSYRMLGTRGSLPGAGAVVPQLMQTVCSRCSNPILGKISCCEVEVSTGPGDVPVLTTGRCYTARCGVAGAILDIFL